MHQLPWEWLVHGCHGDAGGGPVDDCCGMYVCLEPHCVPGCDPRVPGLVDDHLLEPTAGFNVPYFQRL